MIIEISNADEVGVDQNPNNGSFDKPLMSFVANSKICTFCSIIEGKLPGRIRFHSKDIVVFDNHLDWVPLMLLVSPVRHMTQAEMWMDNNLMGQVALIAAKLGQEYAPEGFRLLSNFGGHALQTQDHAHLHILGGENLGFYLESKKLIQ